MQWIYPISTAWGGCIYPLFITTSGVGADLPAHLLRLITVHTSRLQSAFHQNSPGSTIPPPPPSPSSPPGFASGVSVGTRHNFQALAVAVPGVGQGMSRVGQAFLGSAVPGTELPSKQNPCRAVPSQYARPSAGHEISRVDALHSPHRLPPAPAVSLPYRAHRRHLDPTLARAVAFALLAQGFGLCLHIPPGGQMVNPKTNRSKDLWRPDIYLQV